MINCLILSLDYHIANSLRQHIEKTPDLILLKSIAEFKKAKQNVPTIVFTNLESLKSITIDNSEYEYHIVISNNTNHAFHAIENGAHDFLLTPSTYSRFQLTIEKIRTRQFFPLRLNQLDYFYIKNEIRGKIIKIELKEIKYIESAHNYLLIHTSTGTYTTYLSLSEMEGFLPSSQFTRVHKSFIVNDLKIRSVERNQVILDCNTVVILGQSYKEAFLTKLHRNLLEPSKNRLRA